MSKRLFDLLLSSAGLVVLSPLFLLLGALVKASDGGPIFYRQQRVGRGGNRFWIVKFRTMVQGADRMGLSVTRDRDPRITRIGRFLRKTKFDELPQLWNVLQGEMSLVGPRPEVPRYVAHYSEAQRRILTLQPGITSLAAITFRNEEELLAGQTDTESFYLQSCLPRKVGLDLAYARGANLWEDLKLILRTCVGSLPLQSHVERKAAAPGPGEAAPLSTARAVGAPDTVSQSRVVRFSLLRPRTGALRIAAPGPSSVCCAICSDACKRLTFCSRRPMNPPANQSFLPDKTRSSRQPG